jgi:hypothetical protein
MALARFRACSLLAALVVLLSGARGAAAQTQLDADEIYLGTAACRVLTGSGTPESAVAAPVCSIYTRTDSGGGVYRKASGTGNTGWTLIGLPSGMTTGTVLVGGSSDPAWSATPTLTSVTAGTFASGGNIILDPTSGAVLPDTAYGVDLGALNTKYRVVHAAELWVQTLVAADTLSTIGGRIIVAPTTTLIENVDDDSGHTWIKVKQNTLSTGDRIILQSNGKLEFMNVTSSSSVVTGGYEYSVARDQDGSGLNEWFSGDAVVNTGTTGDGFIDQYSFSGVLPGTTVGPTIVGNVRTGTAYNAYAPRWAIGNLNGLYGYSTDTYGAAFGDNSAAWVKIDPTNGVRLGHNATTSVQIDASGNASFAGSVTAPAGYVGGWDIESTSLLATNVGLYSDGTIATTATDFNGTSSVVAGAFSASLPASVYMAAWVYPEDTTTSVAFGVGRNGYGGWFVYQQSGNWSVSFPGVGTFGSATVTTNTWQHLALVRSGGTWTLYKNGVASGTSTATPGDPATNSFKSVGAIRNVGNTAYELFFNGRIAHYTLAHEAFTAAQVARIYNGGVSGAGYASWLFATGYGAQSPLHQYYPLSDDNPLSIWLLGTATMTATATSSVAGPTVNMYAARVQAGSGANTAGLGSANASGDIALWAGSTWATNATAPFRVTSAGALTATSATITGAITATSGNITAALQADSITSAMIQAGTIVASDIASGTITATQIASGTITADRLSVSSLSAISANIGTVTAGTINGVEINFDGGTLNDSDGLAFDNASGDGDFVRSVSWASGALINGQSSILHLRSPGGSPWSQINLGTTFISFWGDTSGGDDGMDLMNVALRPQTNGGLSLGTTSLRWEYLFLVETISISSFAGGGTRYVCVDNTGDFYADTTC